MTKHLRFLIVLLMTLVWSAGWAQTTVFHESFDKCSSSGGNDGKWGTTDLNSTAITNATKSKFLDQAWTGLAAVFPASKCVRLSSNNNPAQMTTPAISSTGDFTIKIKAGDCTGKSSIISLNTTNGKLDKSSVSLTAGDFNEYSIELKGVTQSFTLTFKVAKGQQSFIDDIEVVSKAGGVTLKDPGISFGETTYTANITDKDDTYRSYVSLTNPNNLSVTYASSKKDVAEVNNNGEVRILGVGTTTISAAFAGDDTYMKATVSYELTVVDPNAKENIVVFTAGKEKGKITAKGDERDEMSSKGVTVSGTVIALGNEDYRFYKGCKFTISVTTGTITKIEFKGNGSATKNSLKNLTATGYKAADDKNGTWIGNAQSVMFTADTQARATIITVYVSLPTSETTTLTLDETATNNNIVAKTGVNVTLKRSMVENEWNTICLPFNVTAEQAKTAFGEGVMIAQLNKNSSGNKLSFSSVDAIVASTPYLIKPTIAAPADGYKFEGVTINDDGKGNVAPNRVNTNSYLAFVGIYNTVDVTNNVIEVLNNNYYAAFLGANNTIFKAKNDGGKMKGFRAYFAIPNNVAASALCVMVNGTTTSIKSINGAVVESNAPVYNLQGQRVDGNNLTSGIYIKAGKKFVVR